jgi:hypothetical protein
MTLATLFRTARHKLPRGNLESAIAQSAILGARAKRDSVWKKRKIGWSFLALDIDSVFQYLYILPIF